MSFPFWVGIGKGWGAGLGILLKKIEKIKKTGQLKI